MNGIRTRKNERRIPVRHPLSTSIKVAYPTIKSVPVFG